MRRSRTIWRDVRTSRGKSRIRKSVRSVVKTTAIDNSAIPPRRHCQRFCGYRPVTPSQPARVSPGCHRRDPASFPTHHIVPLACPRDLPAALLTEAPELRGAGAALWCHVPRDRPVRTRGSNATTCSLRRRSAPSDARSAISSKGCAPARSRRARPRASARQLSMPWRNPTWQH